MLLHIKGRTHIQTRLVEPTYKSLNNGDCFILIAGNQLYRYIGNYANVIEKSRSKNICYYIIENKDLGCSATKEIVINDGGGGIRRHTTEFWKILGKPDDYQIPDSGHSDEDDLFETCLIETNMTYEFCDDTLIPIEKYWGSIPKVEMLNTKKVLVFNFGSEVYVWNGKSASSDSKRAALRLAQELFSDEYDYEMCELNPINYSQFAGDRIKNNKLEKFGKLPEWCILAKITQFMESILFKEKFADWPEYERDDLKKDYLLSGCGGEDKQFVPLDGLKLFNGEPYTEPNLILENSNLGRGNFYYDTDTMRHFDILTKSIVKWRINEFNYDSIEETSYGHFYSSESYIIRWIYQISVTVRELSGQVSKRSTVGRDRTVYFCWQGTMASANEKGAAALLTVELDKEKGAQMRLSQGDEPTAFLRLFKIMFIHLGRKDFIERNKCKWRLFLLTGNDFHETILMEINCNIQQLRSRTSLLLINGKLGDIIIWHGCKSLKHTIDLAGKVSEDIKNNCCKELFTENVTNINITEVTEGTESDDFYTALGVVQKEMDHRKLYYSLLNSNELYNFTPRIFHLSSTNNGKFEGVEILSQLR